MLDTVVATRFLRPLPRRIAPVHDETLHSYLTRLARVNRLDIDALREHAAGARGKSAPVPLERLAVLAGRPARALGHAVLELCTAEDLAGMHVHDRPRPGGTVRIACRSCTLARGHTGIVRTWQLHEDVVCCVTSAGSARKPQPPSTCSPTSPVSPRSWPGTASTAH